jgi:hypothetical protein
MPNFASRNRWGFLG